FGEHITSRLVRTQNRELSFRCIAYNTHRITNLTIIIDGFYKAHYYIHVDIHIMARRFLQSPTFPRLEINPKVFILNVLLGRTTVVCNVYFD
ncbi:MAG: hypothetical protein WA323_24190, partial [Candidatus Nitrosopolaris sp.]